MAAGAPKQAYIAPNQAASKNLPRVKDPFAGQGPMSGIKGAGGAAGSSDVGKVPQLTGGPQKINTPAGQVGGTPPTNAPQPVPPPAAPTPTADPTANAFAGIAPPGLTPDQTAAFNTAWNNYQGKLNTDNGNLAQAPITEAATIANDKAAFVQNSETAQAAAASRGLFNSSIKDGALNDIATTQANNDFIAAGQLSSLTKAINADIATLNSNWGATATGAVGDAVINGQNVTPAVPPAAPGAAPAAGGQAAGTYPNVGASAGNAGYIKQVVANPTDWRPAWAQTPAGAPGQSTPEKPSTVTIAQQKAKQGNKGASSQKYGALS